MDKFIVTNATDTYNVTRVDGTYLVEMGNQMVPISKARPALPSWFDSIPNVLDEAVAGPVDVTVRPLTVRFDYVSALTPTSTSELVARANPRLDSLINITVATYRFTYFLKVNKDSRYIWSALHQKYVPFETERTNVQAVVLLAAHLFRGNLPDGITDVMVTKPSTALGPTIEVYYRKSDGSRGVYLPGSKKCLNVTDSWDFITSGIDVKY